MISVQKPDSESNSEFLSQPEVATKGEGQAAQTIGKTDKLATKIAAKILFVQSWVSGQMNKMKYLKLFLICFCVMSAGISSYVLIDAIVSKPKSKIRIDHIKTPKPIYETDEEMYDNKILDEVYQQIQDYKKFADSTGEKIRPGLADSMRILEDMYLEQQK